jgi:hypothetical protein
MTIAAGPIEPAWTRVARENYYARLGWLQALENRICRTDHGLDWLMRVKRIGRTNPSK